MRDTALTITSPLSDLVDIRDVHTDKSLPKMKRCAEYDRQLHGYKHFRYKDKEVTIFFTKGGPPIEDCLIGLVV
jgi:hypothetical protein